jgi:hypothetical protein
MAKFEIEVSDDGKFDTLPDPVQVFVDRKINEAHSANQALKAAEVAKSKAEHELLRLRGGSLDPAERERLKTLEGEHSRMAEEIALRDKKFEEAQTIREDRHRKAIEEQAAKTTALSAEIEKRTQRIRQLALKEIHAAALAAGARRESIPELEIILGTRIGLDDALQVFVTDTQDAGKPQLDKDGKPLSVEGFVADYLAAHPHHVSGPAGRGGAASGGRSLTGQPASRDAARAAALEVVAADPSITAVADFLSKTVLAASR